MKVSKFEGQHGTCSIKKAVLENFANLKKKTLVLESLFYCEICEIYKNTCSEEHLQMTAFVNVLKIISAS